MKNKKVLLLVLFFLLINFFIPKVSFAANTPKISFFTIIGERIEYIFAFKAEKKIEVLEKHAEKRLEVAQDLAKEGDGEGVKNQIQDYNDTKEKQDGLLAKIDNPSGMLGKVEERTIDQQKTMEEIKTNVVDQNVKNEIIQVQENVVNQVAKNIVEVNGKEGQTEFFQKVEQVWAPGTGPGGTAGVVYEGGSKIMFAPGTSGGSPNATQDIKTVEVKTGGGGGGNDGKTIEIKGN